MRKRMITLFWYHIGLPIEGFVDVVVARVAIWYIRRGYGANCETTDKEDFGENYLEEARCGSCRAKEIIDWLEDHIKLIQGK